MKLKQLSVFLENKPGALSAPCRRLAQAGINLLTLCLADTREFGILRLVVRDWEKARQTLEAGGWAVRLTDVVAVEVPDQPGGLAGLLEVFERSGINVEYMYAFSVKAEDRGLLVFRFDDPEAAVAALREAKVSVVDEVELFRRLEA
jgi:hypothetical protein